MFIQVGTDCGVYFVEEIAAVPRTRQGCSNRQSNCKGKEKKEGWVQ